MPTTVGTWDNGDRGRYLPIWRVTSIDRRISPGGLRPLGRRSNCSAIANGKPVSAELSIYFLSQPVTALGRKWLRVRDDCEPAPTPTSALGRKADLNSLRTLQSRLTKRNARRKHLKGTTYASKYLRDVNLGKFLLAKPAVRNLTSKIRITR